MTTALASPSDLARQLRAGPFTRQTWRESLYLVGATVLSAVAVGVVWVTVLTGPAVAITVIGLPVVALVVALELRAARRLGSAQRRMVARTFGEWVVAPPHLRRRPGLWGWFRSSLTDADGWRAVGYLVLTFPLKAVALWLTVLGWAYGIAWATYPLWWAAFSPSKVDPSGHQHTAGVVLGEWFADSWPKALLVAAMGAVILWAVPWVARGMAAVDRAAVRWLLAPRAADRRVAELEERRAHAVSDSAATLRRVERDLHDGTQARLVALAMQLDQAREHLAAAAATGADASAEATADPDATVEDTADPDATVEDATTPFDDLTAARALLDSAHRNATDAITELRDVTRSIHPPALDVGLDTALATLVAGAAIPVRLRADLPRRPSPAVETIAYFCVAELLTNVAKHSGAATAWVDATEDGDRLRLRVIDDGSGGATVTEGRGLAGLIDRVADVDGRLMVDSPSGGPTIVTVDLPVLA
jgi:signal transduction histidine kinase